MKLHLPSPTAFSASHSGQVLSRYFGFMQPPLARSSSATWANKPGEAGLPCPGTSVVADSEKKQEENIMGL